MDPMDEEIHKTVTGELRRDSRVGAARVQVRVEDGEVTLEGRVASWMARQAAQADAARVPGVRQVHNHLSVTHTPAASADAELRRRATQMLRRSGEIDADAISIESRAGNLIVRGTVDAYWKKTLVEERIGAIRGVSAVVNEITVVPSMDRADDLIAKAVMQAIESITPTTVDTVAVRVENGVVTLSGDVPTWMDRNAIYSAILYTDGVVDVVDRLTVQTTIG